MRDFRALKVWVKSYRTALRIYGMTRNFPKWEQYGLSSQLRRASMSVSINIAEGCGRHTDLELAHFLQIAMGSASEVECELMFAGDLKYVSSEIQNELIADVVEVKKMLAAFILKLRRT